MTARIVAPQMSESEIVAALVVRGVPSASAVKTARDAVAARDRYDKALATYQSAPPSSRKAPPSPGRSREVPWPFVSGWFAHNAIPLPKREYRFAPPRRFRMDFAWPEQMVGLEVDGGVWTSGRHTRGSGWTTDTEKLNLAVSMGWRMLRTTPTDFLTHDMAATIKAALEHYRCLTPAP